ncbi:MAG: hypothetical protein ACJAV5_002294 [Vicingaceae bacterium]|jgi:hypothetical protein
MKTFTILLLGLTILSCNQSESKQEKIITAEKQIMTTNQISTQQDTITELLNKALISDTTEFYDWKRNPSFLFFKSGNFLNNTEKNAMVVFGSTDSTYSIKLYSIKDKKWFVTDIINDLYLLPVFFNSRFDDYNFDNQTDIYLQVSASNGYSLSIGYLLTIDPKTKKFSEHLEARELANMKPDTRKKVVISEKVIWCKNNGELKVCKLTNKWVEGIIKTIKEECPCEPEQ